MSWLRAYRDDGPLGLWLGRMLGPRFRMPAVVLLLVATIPLVVVLAIHGAYMPRSALAPGIATVVLFGGASAGRPADRFDWAVPSLLRLLEYGLLLWTAVLAHGWATRSCFALLGVLAYHHYDAVYRLRAQSAPPAWLTVVGGGWEGRVLLGYLALLLNASAVGMAVAAGLLAVLFVGESVMWWSAAGRLEHAPVYADEEGDEE
jgi:Family of unknown function (DUF5941)